MDGFRIRSASFLFEDADLRDDEVIVGCSDVSILLQSTVYFIRDFLCHSC